jgi:hypothetical protein
MLLYLLPPLLAVLLLFAEMVPATSLFPPFSSWHLFSTYSLNFSYSSLRPEFLWLASSSIHPGTPLWIIICIFQFIILKLTKCITWIFLKEHAMLLKGIWKGNGVQAARHVMIARVTSKSKLIFIFQLLPHSLYLLITFSLKARK